MHTNTNISIPDSLTTPTLLSPSANHLGRPFPPSTPAPMAAQGPPQQNPPSSSVLAPQQPQIPTNPDQVSWDGDKMYLSFPPLSISRSPLYSPGSTSTSWTIAKSEVIARPQTNWSSRPTSLQTQNHLSTLSKVFFLSSSLLLSLLTHLIHSIGGGAYFGCYFRPKTMALDLRTQCSITRCLTSATSFDPAHLVPHCFLLVF